MCSSCKDLYPEGDGLEFCPRKLGPDENSDKCAGKLKKIDCLVCEDSGFVVILDPSFSEPEKVTCPRKCGVKGDA